MPQNQKLKNLFRDIDAFLFDSSESETLAVLDELAHLFARGQQRLLFSRLDQNLQSARTTDPSKEDQA